MNSEKMTDHLSAPILVVEDDEDLRDAIAATLRLHQLDFTICESAEAGLQRLDPASTHILITDFKLPGMNGLELIEKVRRTAPHLPVVMMTAFADTALAVQALRAGARDFLVKPFNPEHLVEVIRRYSRAETTEPVADSVEEAIIAVDAATVAAFERCRKLATVDLPGLLTGESGVGKEIFARRIHESSSRQARPFVAINCAAIPEQLLESTMFGFEKGSFTGAVRSQAGKFELADGGTLFLDEIGEMPLGLQAKLLRVLQDKSVERLGSNTAVRYNVRILAATNKNLSELAKNGQFREDLLFRLAVFEIRIPPLRSRRRDIIPLAEAMLVRFGRTMGRTGRTLTPLARELLLDYPWPGNIRELENAIQRALLINESGDIEPEDFELNVPPGAPTGIELADDSQGEVLEDMETVERRHILRVLSHVNGNRKQAAELLGISERGLRYKLKNYEDLGFVAAEGS
jgi:two-component system response regulator FlrC